MFYREDPLDENEQERLELAEERIREIPEESGERLGAAPAFADYFRRAAQFLVLTLDEYAFLKSGGQEKADFDTLAARNRALYEDILPENYVESYAAPGTAVKRLSAEYGPYLSSLVYEIRSVIPFLYMGATAHALIRYELFLEIYSLFAEQAPGFPPAGEVRERIRSYLYDYAEYEDEYEQRIRLVQPDTAAARIVRAADLTDLRYLYAYGDYITEDEIRAARYLNSLPEEKLNLCADTYTEGYRSGFLAAGKDLSKKKYASVYYHIGFERLQRRAFRNLEAMGLEPVTPHAVLTLFRSSSTGISGWEGADPNPQYGFDHREDLALYLDRALASRRTEALAEAYRAIPETVYFAGPAVMEVFGEQPFSPKDSPYRAKFDETGRKLTASMNTKEAVLYADAVVAAERSFTVIDFPMPAIAETQERYAEIFDAVIRINTLDSGRYARIQAHLIDALNRAEYVEVKGSGKNRTDLKVQLFRLTDPEHQSIFENCVADVNIPVGEVFTSPVLEGTEGILHVTGVYLEGLFFQDLWLKFRDGRVCDYGCGNFADSEACRQYIEENILFHHKDLPMGECAIGTNTTAFVLARKYGIEARLPILIAEKTGPHFAVGDTCYSHEEDNHVYNPDGKEIVAKENSVSRCRKEDPEKAYFGCHTDITIPYDELGEYTAVCADGTRIPIIRNGRFVLPGTEELNRPLEEAGKPGIG